MAEVRYLISDAAKQVDVESHVLRYWEDELELQIPRNEMGHRYYTDYYIRLFRQIKDLKEKGYQLKAIKNALNKMSGAMGDIIITEDYMEEDMKAAWKESRMRERQMKERARAQKKAAQAGKREMDESQMDGGEYGGKDCGGRDYSGKDYSGRDYDGSAGGENVQNSGTCQGDMEKEQVYQDKQVIRLHENQAYNPAHDQAHSQVYGQKYSQTSGQASGQGNKGGQNQENEPDQQQDTTEMMADFPEGDEELHTLQAVQITTEKMEQFQQLMNHVIGHAMDVNMERISREITNEVNETISETICETVSETVSDQVTDRVMKEVEYLMRVNDEREEERFKQLDETIRAYQKNGKGRAEAAATKMPFFKKKRFGKSGKKLF